MEINIIWIFSRVNLSCANLISCNLDVYGWNCIAIKLTMYIVILKYSILLIF